MRPFWSSLIERRAYPLLTVLTLVAFATAIPNGFVWIDHWQVVDGGLVAHSWGQLWRFFHEPLGSMPGWQGAAPYARPLVVATFSLDYWFGGLHPTVYHATLVLLHVVNVALVYGLLCDLNLDRVAAFIAAGLFAVHPVQTAAVSWISGIADPLFVVFVLLAFRLQLRASTGTGHVLLRRIGAVVCFILAVGAKETALLFPPLLVAAYLIFPATLPIGATAGERRLGAVTRAIWPYAMVVMGDVAYRFVVLGGAALGGSLEGISLAVRLRTVPRLLMSYITLPLRFGALTICDDYRLSTAWDVRTVLAIVALTVLCALIWGRWRHWPHAAFGLLWMLLGLVPVLNLVPILHYRADRFFYFPMIGWSVMVVVLTRACVEGIRRRVPLAGGPFQRASPAVLALGLIALAVLTARRNTIFVDDRTLFKATVAVSPFCREAHTALGDSYLRAGHMELAAAQYEFALRNQPDRASYVVLPKVLINLGLADLGRRQYAAAQTAFARAHRLQPDLLHPLFGLGIANLGLGHVADAAKWLQRAYAAAPNDPDVVFNLALSYDRLSRGAEAVPLYRHFLAIAPHSRLNGFARQRLQAIGASATR